MYKRQAETFLIDDGEEEQEEEHRRLFNELQGAPSGGGEANTETKASEAPPDDRAGKAQKKVQSYVGE